MTERTLRGKAAIVGIGETPDHRHGKSPDFGVQAGADGGGRGVQGCRNKPA